MKAASPAFDLDRFKEYRSPRGLFPADRHDLRFNDICKGREKKVKMQRCNRCFLSLPLSIFLATRFATVLRDEFSSLAFWLTRMRCRRYDHRKHRERRFVRGTIEGQCISGRCATECPVTCTCTYTHTHTRRLRRLCNQVQAAARERKDSCTWGYSRRRYRIADFLLRAAPVIFHDNDRNNFQWYFMHSLNTPDKSLSAPGAEQSR